MNINTGTVTLLPQWDLEYTKNYNTKHAQRILAVYREVFFFSSEEGLVKVFPTRGKKRFMDLKIITLLPVRRVRQKTAAREPFLFMSHICLCSQIPTLRRSPSSLLHSLNAEGRRATQDFLEAFSCVTPPSFPTWFTRICGTAPEFSVGCSDMQLLHCLHGVCSLPLSPKKQIIVHNYAILKYLSRHEEENFLS